MNLTQSWIWLRSQNSKVIFKVRCKFTNTGFPEGECRKTSFLRLVHHPPPAYQSCWRGRKKDRGFKGFRESYSTLYWVMATIPNLIQRCVCPLTKEISLGSCCHMYYSFQSETQWLRSQLHLGYVKNKGLAQPSCGEERRLQFGI